MASTFPGAIDNFTDPLSNSSLASPSHAGQHSDLNDAVEKIETYMGLVKVIPTSVSSAGGTAATLAANGTVNIGTSNTSIVVNGVFSALYDHYRVIYSSQGNGSAVFHSFNLTSAGTAAASGYYRNGTTMTSNSTTVIGNAAAAATTFDLGTQQSGTDPFYGTIEIYSPYRTRLTFMRGESSTYLGGFGYNYTFQGTHNVASAYDGFRFSVSTGNFTSGTIRVYGYRN